MSILPDLLVLLFLFLINASAVIFIFGPVLLLQPARRKREWYARFTTILEPRDAKLPQEDVVLRTHDGMSLSGWLVAHTKKPKGAVIYLHGVGDCKIGGIAVAKLLYNNGYDVLLYDSRHHGESEGRFCTYGFYEKRDVSAAIDFLRRRPGMRECRVAIFGTSMGAAVAIQAAAIDERIAGVVAEASFTDLRTIFVDYQRRIIKLPWHFLRNFAMSRSQTIANFKARLVSPIDDVVRVKAPLLFVHGTKDSFIRYQYSKKLYDRATGPKQLLLIEGADHNDVWDVGGKKYETTILEFFAHALSGKKRTRKE